MERPDMGGFVFLISHPSFDVVSDGAMAPPFSSVIYAERVKLARDQSSAT